jgi:hypothetical protein
MNGLKRLSLIFSEGSREYGDHNYREGRLPFSNIWNHMLNHMVEYATGNRREDHLAKVAWGAFAMMEIEREHPEANDLRWNSHDVSMTLETE